MKETKKIQKDVLKTKVIHKEMIEEILNEITKRILKTKCQNIQKKNRSSFRI